MTGLASGLTALLPLPHTDFNWCYKSGYYTYQGLDGRPCLGRKGHLEEEELQK